METLDPSFYVSIKSVLCLVCLHLLLLLAFVRSSSVVSYVLEVLVVENLLVLDLGGQDSHLLFSIDLLVLHHLLD